jgi:hypothetical protein
MLGMSSKLHVFANILLELPKARHLEKLSFKDPKEDAPDANVRVLANKWSYTIRHRTLSLMNIVVSIMRPVFISY